VTAQDRVPRWRRGNRRTDRTGPAASNEVKAGTNGIFPPPRPFWWLPVDGQRHAIQDCDRTSATGEPVRTLCGATHDRPAPPSDVQWLWRTCALCWNEACKIVESR
jgi:hypothetical protein